MNQSCGRSEFKRLMCLLVDSVWQSHLSGFVEQLIENYDGSSGDNITFCLGKVGTIRLFCPYSFETPEVVRLILCTNVPEDGGALGVSVKIPRNLESGKIDLDVKWNIPLQEAVAVLGEVITAYVPAHQAYFLPSRN